MSPDHCSRKRILMIAPTPFFADRGCHVRILGEARALIALGNELILCTYPIGRDIEGVPVERTLAVPWYTKLSAGPSYHKFYIDLLLLGKVLLICRRYRPDIIHAHLHEGIVIGKVASKLFHTPLVADLQGSLTAELLDHRFIPRAPWFVRCMYWLEKQIDQLPLYLITSSTQTAKICTESLGLSPQHIIPIMDGVDLDVFSPQEDNPSFRASIGISPHEKVVVFTGVLTEYQGIDLLLESIALVVEKVPHAKFLVVGYPREDMYRQKAQAIGVEKWTCFTGKVPYHEIPRYLSLASVAVSPKLSTTEANLKLFTYMAMGLPTVVFDTPVNREILGELGIYARFSDAKALADALVDILCDETRAKELGHQSRAKALRDYSWSAAGTQLMRLYNAAQ